MKPILTTALLLALAAPVSAAPKNIVMIVSDDLAMKDLDRLPSLMKLAAEGTSFDMALAEFPLCTPTRTTLITGMSQRHHGIYENDAGMFDPAWPTLGTRLQAAGYRTGIVGKLLNQMRRANFDRLPGWDTYQVMEKHSDFGDQQAHVLANRASRFLRDCAKDGVPCFLYLAPVSPHGPSMGPPECTGPWPEGPSTLDEHTWHRRMSSLCGLDGLIAKVARNAPPDTVFIFLSDQGFGVGENAGDGEDDDARVGKSQLILDALQFPLLVWGPGIEHTARREIVSTVDVTATVLDLAGADAAGIDGRTLVPLLHAESPRWGGSLLLEGR